MGKIKIFISYTTRDVIITKHFLQQIENILSPNFDIFIDILHNNSINKQKRVEEELFKAQCVLVIDTPNINKSLWVTKEIQLANKLGKKIITIPPNCINNVTDFIRNNE